MALEARVIKVAIPAAYRAALRAGEKLSPDATRYVDDILRRPGMGFAINDNIVGSAASRGLSETIQLIFAAAYVADQLDGFVFEFLKWAYTGQWPVVSQGGWRLPAGIVFSEGPCLSPNPAAGGGSGYTAFGAFICGYQAQTTQRVREPDSAINADLAAGGTVSVQNEQFRADGYWWYQTLARVTASDPANFEPWDSSIHGYTSGASRIQYDPALSQFEQIMQDFLARRFPRPASIPMDNFNAVVPGSQWLPSTEVGWWLRPELEIPVVIRPGQSPVVIFPGIRPAPSTGVDVPVVPRPEVNPRPDIRPGVRPGTRPGVNPGTPPTLNPRPVVDPFQPPAMRPRVLNRVNSVTQVNNGYRRPPERGEAERKGEVAKAVFQAMQVMGAVSEVGDTINAVYKSLPLALRRKLRDENGKSLNWSDQLRALIGHYDEINVPRAVALILIQNLDDVVAAAQGQPFDKALQKLVPDYLTRMAVRQAIRWAVWESGIDIPQLPQIEDSLKKLGVLEK